jgi:hypothetical protein
MSANPIRQIEEAIFLLRRLETRAWLLYLLAAVPFSLALLQFVRDMSTSHLAPRCALDSLACALAFLWAAAWKAKFGAALLAKMNGPGFPSSEGRFWRAFYRQSVLQALKLVVWPFALISILPIPFTTLFFRNAAIEAGSAHTTLPGIVRKSARRASHNLPGSWLAIFILSVIYLIAFINVYLLMALLPFLLRMFSGVETLFTRNSGALFGFNVFSVVVVVTWLLIDPLLLSYAAVRCFHTEARTDARDLLAKLRPLAALALVLLFFAPAPNLFALSKEQLSHAVEQAAKSDDYAWLRAQKQPANPKENTFFANLNRDIENLSHTVGSWLSGVRDWLRRLLQSTPASPSEPAARPITGDVRWLLYALAAIVLLAALMIVFRRTAKPALSVLTSSPHTPAPDLGKDNILASDLPEEEWLRMASELLAKGESRLGVRALYLSNLSYLASRHLIQIARSKSNSIYETELRRRPHSADVSPPFAWSNRAFERVWYGFHDVSSDLVEAFQHNVEVIRRHGKA